MKSLKQRALEIQEGKGIMEGREKGETSELIGKIVTLNDYCFMRGEKGSYVVYTIKEADKLFYFGSSQITEALLELDGDGYKETIQQEGLPMRITMRTTLRGWKFYSVEFYPIGG